MGFIYALIALVGGGSFIWTGIHIWASDSCQLVTLHFGGRIVDSTCWIGYHSVKSALTGGWAASISIAIGLVIWGIALIIAAVEFTRA